jgi:hypothetical protein
MGLPRVNQRRLRILQALAAVIVLSAIGIGIVSGQTLYSAFVGGTTIGGMTFLLAAAVLFVYWGVRSTLE